MSSKQRKPGKLKANRKIRSSRCKTGHDYQAQFRNVVTFGEPPIFQHTNNFLHLWGALSAMREFGTFIFTLSVTKIIAPCNCSISNFQTLELLCNYKMLSSYYWPTRHELRKDILIILHFMNDSTELFLELYYFISF